MSGGAAGGLPAEALAKAGGRRAGANSDEARPSESEGERGADAIRH